MLLSESTEDSMRLRKKKKKNLFPSDRSLIDRSDKSGENKNYLPFGGDIGQLVLPLCMPLQIFCGLALSLSQ